VSAAQVEETARPGLFARLAEWITDGRLEPDMPHRYAPDWQWPTSCWCGQDAGAKTHQSRIGAL
jgi:hypothetical protein